MLKIFSNNANLNKIYLAKKISIINIFAFCAVIFSLMLVTACSKAEVTEKVVVQEGEYIEEVNQWFPALWINGEEYSYQPLYANKTPLNKENRLDKTIYFTSLGIPFTVESNEAVMVDYSISRRNGSVIEEGNIQPMIVQSDQSHIFDISPLDYSKYEIGEIYTLEIALSINGQKAYYYSDLYYSNIDGNAKSIEKVYDYLKADLKDKDISFMNVPRFWIHVQEDGISTIRSEYTGATRLDEGFEYKDYVKLFNVDIINGTLELTGEYYIDKQRYFYSSEENGWVLGNQFISDEDITVFNSFNRHVLISKNQKYELIYSANELYLNNVEEEKLEEIYRLDSFDSDYIYDEYQNHKIKIIDFSDSGDVYFAVLGYVHDDSDYNQRTGINFYKYGQEELININFMEREGTISQLELYLDNQSYYNAENEKMYFFDKQSLYMFDLKSHEFTYVDAYLKANFNRNAGALTWQGNDSKFNGAIYTVNLNNEIISVENLYQTGVYKRLLATSRDHIYVGEYYVEDTYEALNGLVTYPYAKVSVYDFNGVELMSYNHLDYGDHVYFSEVYYDDVTQEWKSDLIERQIKSSEISKNSRLDFLQTNGSIILDGFEETIVQKEVFNQAISIEASYPSFIIETKPKNEDIVFLKSPKLLPSKKRPIELEPHPQKNVYKIVDAKGDILYTSTFVDALQLSREKRNYQIYYSQYTNSQTNVDELVFDSSSLLTSQYLEEVITQSQRPELPRGCEVTSLSILLDYYLDQAPSKMELASQLKVSNIEYKIIDGFVNFSNMHYEFAGSMDNTNEPGLGVYIEPVRDLAQDYIDQNPTNISGVSFEQLLTFVSNRQPVLIIIPNRYQAVADYAIEVWKTNSGYMEVTYQEHSVVVMGFDENYVYYSDPSKGIIDKKSIQSFKNAWESIGNQGLVILE